MYTEVGDDCLMYAELFSAKSLGLPKSTGITEQGTLAPVGDKEFSRFLSEELHSGSIVRPYPPPDSRGYSTKVRPPSAYSERAKTGFVYWCREPQRIKYGKYHLNFALLLWPIQNCM